MFSPLEQFDVITLIPISFLWWYDISFTNVILPIFTLNVFFYAAVVSVSNEFKLIPDAWQYVIESIFRFVFTIVDQQVGVKGYVYLPLFFTMFNFILLCNFSSLVPFGIALTSYIIITLFISTSLFLSIFVIGLLEHKLKFFYLFVPEAPFFLLFVLIPIEIFSYFIRMFSLAIRLTANIFAGHTLVYIIASFATKVLPLGILFSLPAFYF